MRCLIGLDDTDSRIGRCTTHLGYRIVGALLSQGCVFSRYPKLVRLNPNIPFKTRGNASVCLDFESRDPVGAFYAAESLIRELADVENGANAGAVFVERSSDIRLFRPIYEAAISGMVNPKRVGKFLKDHGINHSILGNGMGLVGKASLGFDERDDHTYELIAYRQQRNIGKRRLVDAESVKRAERTMFPHCLNNYDYGSERVLVTPHGPDPVFLGVRADSPGAALSAYRMMSYEEELAGHMIYASNQCTDAHLGSKLELPLSAYSAGWLGGEVKSVETGEGGHLYVSVDVDGSRVPSVVYGPAGDLSRAARRLMPGDRVRIFGGVRKGTSKHPSIVNIEKIEVLRVAPSVEHVNPACGKCGGPTKSEGREKGFECRRCGARSTGSKRTKRMSRVIEPGIYLPSAGAQRHLTKQLIRYGRESYSQAELIEGWIETEAVRPLRAPVQSPR